MHINNHFEKEEWVVLVHIIIHMMELQPKLVPSDW